MLTRLQREDILPYLEDEALAMQNGVSPPEEIDRLGIVKATCISMERA